MCGDCPITNNTTAILETFCPKFTEKCFEFLYDHCYYQSCPIVNILSSRATFQAQGSGTKANHKGQVKSGQIGKRLSKTW